MKLIKVTPPTSNVKIKINPEHIVFLEPQANGGSYVRLAHGVDTFTRENIDEIESLIQKADNL